MHFTTPVSIPNCSIKADFKTSFFLMGSCFTQNIGQKLLIHKCNAMVNPMGVIYNPLSISELLYRIIDNIPISQSDVIFENGLYQSYLFHSSFADSSLDQFVLKANAAIQSAHHFLKQAEVLLLTFGSSWYYSLKSNGCTVANCHKQPKEIFNRQLANVEEITKSLEQVLKKLNPSTQIVFTISPVRHLRDGAFENNVSKAQLFTSVYQLLSLSNTWYFPAYEIVMDELRDYRFYDSDFVHPSAQAVDYIWEKFSQALFTRDCLHTLPEILSIYKATHHKPLNVQTPDFKKFIEVSIQKCIAIQQKYPEINFTDELNYFEEVKG